MCHNPQRGHSRPLLRLVCLLWSLSRASAIYAENPHPGGSFGFSTVIDLARASASSAYVQVGKIDDQAGGLSYDQYRDIRSPSAKGLWADSSSPFIVDPLPSGYLFTSPVHIAAVDPDGPHEVLIQSGQYILGPSVPSSISPSSLSTSGFRIRHPLNSPNIWDEFLVFQGASYFRAVPRGGRYGLSARGLAIRTGSDRGEEFPSFTRFWIVRPAAGDKTITVYALLDSPSVAGAYRFCVSPGAETVMDVDFTLFPRVDLDDIGIAPLTSMFLFGKAERPKVDDFRGEVHDSDGLFILTDGGEALWRPLRNPKDLQVSSFTTKAPRLFGLFQRSRRGEDYGDLEALYELRPDAWVEPLGDWGAGTVELVEIPSLKETDDNIVALWKPAGVLLAGDSWSASYRLHWSLSGGGIEGLGQVSNTRSGLTMDGQRRLFVIDFSQVPSDMDRLTLDVSSSTGGLFNYSLHKGRESGSVRASLELDDAVHDLVELRARLLQAGQAVSETWLYQWTK